MADDWHEKLCEQIIDEMVNDYAWSIKSQLKDCRERCESPIEEALLAALFQTVGMEHIPAAQADIYCSPNPCTSWPHPPTDGAGIVIFPQSQVGPYRADFLICGALNDDCFWIVVECDGHDFHEKTKYQARRDKARDRWMQAQRIVVFRFTGQEIFENARRCADEVADMIARKFGELV